MVERGFAAATDMAGAAHAGEPSGNRRQVVMPPKAADLPASTKRRRRDSNPRERLVPL
jgi:hypothetical protein